MTPEWIESYSCGCSQGFTTRAACPGYCAIHGSDWREIIKPSGQVIRKLEADADRRAGGGKGEAT